MNKHDTHDTLRKWLDYRHPEQWGKLDCLTQEFLNNEYTYINSQATAYADTHRAASHSSYVQAFYQEASNDEIQKARRFLSDLEITFDPYQLMCNHNYYILVDRYIKTIRDDLETIRSILDEDQELPEEIYELENGADPKTGLDTNVAKQLQAQADHLSERSDHWLVYVENLLDK